MDRVLIRKATFQDAAEIANVHINSWREAYHGLIHEDFLNDRPLQFKNHYSLWKKVTLNENQTTFVAESDEHGIIGFINGAMGRDKGMQDQVEIWCLYLLEKYQGKKIGFNLLKNFFNKYKEIGHHKGYAWVLKNNPSVSFYEVTGAKFNGQTKDEKVGLHQLPHLCYSWNKLNL
jgi:ribosomal protein S18 acetylase RimI-like enzyme